MTIMGRAAAGLFLCYFGLIPSALFATDSLSTSASMSETSPSATQDVPHVIQESPTYSNPTFGLSFRIPNNYTLIQGQGAGWRMGDSGLVPEDYGEYLFAKLQATTPYNLPVFSASPAAIYFGVHLGISAEDCLAPLNFPSFRSKGVVVLGEVTFHWSADPLPEHLAGSLASSPFGNEYFRNYAGFANSVCYEFHLRTKASPRENALAELESVLASIRIFPRTPAVHSAPGQFEAPFPIPGEILDLLKFAPWRVTYPKMGQNLFRPLPSRAGQLGEATQPPATIRPFGSPASSQSNAITFSFVSQSSDGDEATAAIANLERDIIMHLQEHQWSASSDSATRPYQGSYRKDGAVLEISKGTGCHSPCTQFDSLTITVYIPSNP